jgi:hypothetical protein
MNCKEWGNSRHGGTKLKINKHQSGKLILLRPKLELGNSWIFSIIATCPIATFSNKAVMLCEICSSVQLCNHMTKIIIVGWDSAVGIAICYGLDGLGIESRCGRDFPHPLRPALGPTQPPIQWVSGFFPGGKAVGVWSWPPAHQLEASLKKE